MDAYSLPKRYCQMTNIVSDAILGVDNTIEIWANEMLEKTLVPADDFSARIQTLMDNDFQND